MYTYIYNQTSSLQHLKKKQTSCKSQTQTYFRNILSDPTLSFSHNLFSYSKIINQLLKSKENKGNQFNNVMCWIA
ncbi:hypothetical protein HanXRQr2_Chr10g0440401 [Helianthus annuus]|uniref:Uncharacterized protein n=1 Tax=Helianthus annuus TaxID=4232 RepID=A0A9K3HY84_HELAN|nr:hypothetical protein HanXRQr2_Chr10g0440401 [Helianthus annuus]